MYRQGDLLFVEVDEIPEDAKVRKNGIIAEGEVTGHHHRLAMDMPAEVLFAGENAYVDAHGTSQIVHDEHNTVVLPVGKFEVRRQREYEPNGWRQVVD